MSKPAKPKAHKDEPEELKAKIKELTDALQRERADATNMARRHEQDLSNLRLRVKAGVVRELLPVIDNFERALKHIPKELESSDYVKGITAIVRQFEKTLADMGIEKIKTVGEPFDPRYHEAVHMEDSGGSTEIVSEELQAGYKLGDDVIRHAMVRVRN